ncbi:MAG: hypothetical protein ACYDCL_04920 [Myxococcales bacterium]
MARRAIVAVAALFASGCSNPAIGTSSTGAASGSIAGSATGGTTAGNGSTGGSRGTSSGRATSTAGTQGVGTGGGGSGGGISGAPLVLYTDIVSGPNSGGENGEGAYLSIFGKNFGTTGLGTAVQVTIGGQAVASYRTLGPSLGRSDIEQITVQVGALGNPPPGTPLPIQVLVNGVGSNPDEAFTVNPGRMIFVDGDHGDDSTAVPGDITHPFQHVQLTGSSRAALDVAQPGDTIVLRQTLAPYADIGDGQDFVKVIDVGGSAPTGVSGTGWLAFVPYPGETVAIVNGSGGVADAAAFSGFDHTSGSYTGGDYVVITGLHIEGDGTAGVICLQISSDHWRVVNDELSAPNTNGANVLAGGVNGDGTAMAIYGNHIHDITGGGGTSHGVYLDGDGSYDVAYNVIENIASGYGVQAYDDEGTSPTLSHVHVHHNLIHGVTGKGCLNVADGTASDIAVWDNVCYSIKLSCLRFNDSGSLRGAEIFNNTFFGCGAGDAYDGAIDSDGNQLGPSQVTLVNNIFWPASGIPYTGGSGNGFGAGAFVNDLWYGSTGQPADAAAITANPEFVAPGSDFHLAGGSPAAGAGSASVSSLVTTNFESTPEAAPFDVGAY